MTPNAVVTPDHKITKEDIEAKLRDIRGDVGERAEAVKVPALAIAVGAAVLAVAAAYFLGRRKGKRRQTVLEIRRI